MAFDAIKATRVVDTALALLERDSVLGALVWKNAGGDFRGAKDDTISLRLPAYVAANSRTLRAGSARSRSTLAQRKVDVTLTKDLYVDVEITDEEATLDIVSFATDVMAPGIRGIVRAYEDTIATLMTGATYENEVTMAQADSGPYDAIIDARKYLNDANVPQSGRALVVGSSVEAAILKSPNLARFDGSGSDSALREATVGRFGGFTVVTSNAIPSDEAYAFHQTAYAVGTRAPFVPQGAAWGASLSEGGYAVRAVQTLDPDTITDILALDAWVGSNVVKDVGTVDLDGKFVPAEDPEDSGASEIFVRAVKITLGS